MMDNKKKLFLLDAYALIFRAYYAFINRPIKNSKGLNTSAIFGFVNTLDEVIRKEQPGYIAVAFDPPSPTFRHDLYDAYKANREATPPDIKLSVPYIKKILEAYHIPVLEYDGYEADDVIGTISKKAKKEGFEVYMMTPDKDYAQLVEEGIFMYKPRRSGNDNEILGVEEIRQIFEIDDPVQVIEVLALWGDSSDNIPGAPGIGEKTAKKLIAQYGTLENLLANTKDLKGKQKENLEEYTDQVLMSKKLVTIDTDVPINISLDEFVAREPDKNKLKGLFNELEFRTLSKRILGDSIPGTSGVQGTLFEAEPAEDIEREPDHKAFDVNEVSYKLVNDEKELDNLVSILEKSGSICFDTETTGLDVLEDELVGLAISTEAKKAWYIPFSGDGHMTKELLGKFRKIFGDDTKLKIGHNLKFDIEVLNKYGIHVAEPFFDTMVAHYILHPEARHKLDTLAEVMLGYTMVPIEELIGEKGKDQLNMLQVPVEKVKDYACEDADITFRLYNILSREISENQFQDLFSNIEMPLITALIDMELAGFKLDTDSLDKYSLKLDEEINSVQNKIHELAGESFNIASPKQLGVILFEKLKISPNTKMTRTKQYSTSEEVLQRLVDSHPIVGFILEYRSLTKLQSTYVSALPKLVNKRTGRIHTSFNQTIAATGRLSSVNPNLQNIPIREERGREIRKSFIPENDNYLLLSADYSQIELRIMAHISGDENMIRSFRDGEDIHTTTAAKVYKVSPQEVTREMRSNAKTANFGIIYGISAFGLSQRLRIPRSEAKELIDSYFDSFPKVKEYMEKSVESAKKNGFVKTLYDRKRYLPDILSNNSVVRGVAERNAINSPIQGTAADVIKIAMIRIHQSLSSGYKTKMILQVHDELIFDVHKPEFEEIKELVRHEMEHAAQLSIPLVVEIGYGQNWMEAH
jgi:DNA polymerase-1